MNGGENMVLSSVTPCETTMTVETYSNVFEAYSNKPVGYENESDEDQSEKSHERSDPSSGLDGKGRPIGTPDSNTESCVVDVGGTLIDYGAGNGSRADTTDKNYSDSATRGSRTQVGADGNSWSFAATSIQYKGSNTDRACNYNPYSKLLYNKRFDTRREKYKKLNKRNSGTRDDDRQTKECHTEDFTVTRNFAAKLGLKGHFVHEAGRMLRDYDAREVGTNNHLYKAALSALALAHKEHFHNEISDSNIHSDNKNTGDKHDGNSTAISHTKAPFSSWKDGWRSWDSYQEDGLTHRGQPIHQTPEFKELMNEHELDEHGTELRTIQSKLKNTDAYKEVYCETPMTVEPDNEREIADSVELTFLNHVGGGEITEVERPSTMMVSSTNTSVAV
jgi:hypothetical protein